MERELRERMVELAIADLRNNVDDGEVIDFLEDITDEIYNDLEDENYDYYEDDYDYDYEEEDSELDRLTEELDRLTEKLDDLETSHKEEYDDPFLAALEAVFGPNVNVRVVESREALLNEDNEMEDEAEDLEEDNELDELEEKLRNLKEDEEDLAFSLDMEDFSEDTVDEITKLIKKVLGE